MKIGPKYKIARRLGAPIFEKTQTQKYAIRSQNKKSTSKPKAKSEFGLGMLEKQKARFTYGITERQFSKYVKNAIDIKGNSAEFLIKTLESRLDSVIYRSGIANTRRFGRQLVSHGHILVNGKTVKIPSYEVKPGDIITIKQGSKLKGPFSTLEDKFKTVTLPAWLKVNLDKKEVMVDGMPAVKPSELLFNTETVLEFYTR